MATEPPQLETSTARRRGRPAIYRDQSQKIEGARLRKRFQRERERHAGLQTAEIRLPAEILTELAQCALLTFTDPKELAARFVATALPAFRQKIERLEKEAGSLWLKATPYLHHGALLQDPGSRHRANGRTLTHEEWRSVIGELTAFRQSLAAEGWPPWRVDRFLRRSAERVALSRKYRG